jgi:type IV secretion system protein VirB8
MIASYMYRTLGIMDQQSLRENIETGAYFVEARKWYNSVFLSPIRHNALMFAVLISVGVMLLFVGYGIYQSFPLVQPTQIVVNMEDTLKYSATVKDISQPGRSTKELILSYLAEKYVLSREVYDPTTFKSHYFFIMRSTAKDLFNQYYASISNTNDPNNPSILYKNGFRNKINFISYIYDATNNLIAVNFVKQTYNLNTGISKEDKLQATIGFTTSDYDFNVAKNTRFNFIVTNYAIAQSSN